ncbi:TetR/AcrR family transcriptional regulator [Pseudoruegeria sp. HB172150]|uniref:TetR/AcrR family transcriptional regulator n=1 Tax=Pseudoruegeria sp. HB172150 TaxID=2721164 RepID=UPI001C12DF24|nr:TetR/AcrR family transcriptional regulator [Pseudoruegeria sp. HB172150]
MAKALPQTAGSPWPTAEDRDRVRLRKKEAVLSAAVRLFNSKGFNATSLDDVAEALQVTKPTIYHYFANKDEILFECVRRGLCSINDAAARVAAQGGSGADRLRALMTDYAKVMTQDFGMCVTRTADSELSAESRSQFRALKRQIDLTVRRVVEEGVKDGSLHTADARLATFTMTGALNWIGRWYDPEGEMSAEAVAAGIVSTLMNGLAATGKAA